MRWWPRLLSLAVVLCASGPAAAQKDPAWQEIPAPPPPEQPEVPAPPKEAAKAPAAPLPSTVAVTFRGPTVYRVLAGRLSCTAPCVLDLPPGPAQLVIVAQMGGYRGGGQVSEIEQQVDIPAQPVAIVVDVGPRTRRTIGKAFTLSGAVIAAVGATTLATGLALDDGNPQGTGVSGPRLAAILGGAFMGMGAIYLAVGGALWATGYERVLELRPQPAAQPAALRVTGLGVVPLRGGGATANVSFAF